MIPTCVRMELTAASSGPRLRRGLVELLENLFGHMKRAVGRRYAAIDGRLQQHFLDLVTRDTVVECGADMEPEFIGPIQGYHHRHRDQAARMPRQARPGPYLAPGVAGDQFLKFLVEGVAARHRPIDVRVAQHRTAHFHSLRISLALVHVAAPQRSRNPKIRFRPFLETRYSTRGSICRTLSPR